MATYAELFGIADNNTLLDRMTAAVALQAEAIRLEAASTTNHTNRLLWAKAAYTDPRGTARRPQRRAPLCSHTRASATSARRIRVSAVRSTRPTQPVSQRSGLSETSDGLDCPQAEKCAGVHGRPRNSLARNGRRGMAERGNVAVCKRFDAYASDTADGRLELRQ